MGVGVGMDKVRIRKVFTRVCAALVFVCIAWQLYLFELMRRFHNLQKMGFPDTTESFVLLGSTKYLVLLFSIVCAFLVLSMWRWKNNRILTAVILAVLVFCITFAIGTWVVITAYTPVLEQGG
jgi:heme A synthase